MSVSSYYEKNIKRQETSEVAYFPPNKHSGRNSYII